MPKDAVKSRKRKEDKIVNQLLTLNEEDIRTYQGNPLLKRAGEKVELTAEHIKEYKRCMEDPVYFAERYIKIVHVDKGLIPIVLYDYQKRIIKALQDYRYNIVLSCRQSGDFFAHMHSDVHSESSLIAGNSYMDNQQPSSL